MLGKRCRTLQRTASISHNMGPHFLHHNHYHNYHDQAANHPVIRNADTALSSPLQPTNPHTQAIPQIIGFNPIIKHDQSSPQSKAYRPPNHPSQNLSARPPPHDLFDDDPAYNSQQKLAEGSITTTTAPGGPSKRSQVTPRSALQTLLAAARQITCSTDHQSPATTSQNHEGNSSYKSLTLIKASSASPSRSTAATSSFSAKQGSLMWPGFSLGQSKPKEISTSQNTIKSVMMKADAKSVSECFSLDIFEPESDSVIFHVEGTPNFATDCHFGLESGQPQHALYLATSPLAADLIPNLAASMSFMESCYLCKRPLGLGRDIFMYRGESAFCSTECRDKHMRLEERKENLRCMRFKICNDMENHKVCNNTDIAGRKGASHNQHNKSNQHHHHEYNSQAYSNKQHCSSLLVPTT